MVISKKYYNPSPQNRKNLAIAFLKCNNIKCKQNDKGICETILRKHYTNHKKSFNLLIKSKNDTTLSIEYWTLTEAASPETYLGNKRTV